jgi:excisionase family DNA binding protein
MTYGEVANCAEVTERTIYPLAGAKQIRAFKFGGSWRFRQSDVDMWIARKVLGKGEGNSK